MTRTVLGVIGGSGVYDLPGLEEIKTEHVATPWGEPSDALRFGHLAGTDIVFLPRHGRGHRLSPSGINYRANIDAMKRVGVTDLIAVSACGSFREELPPGKFVAVDQIIDHTHGRESSFFGNGCVAHVSMAHPIAPLLRQRLLNAARESEVDCVDGGVYLCMEGPQFSSRAESFSYRNRGCDVIGMTAMPEAKLAREAEISYALLAMATDYDCWRDDHDAVDVASILAVIRSNAAKAARLLAQLARDLPQVHEACPIGSDRALDHAMMTAPEARDPILMRKLDAVAGRLLRQA